MFDFLVDGEVLRFCPVCGEVENGERLELIENTSADAMTESLPMGEVVVRTNKTYLSLAFEYVGECTTIPTGLVRFSLPAELLEGMKRALVAPDGMETELLFEEKDGEISFDLDFTDVEIPVMLIRLYPEA